MDILTKPNGVGSAEYRAQLSPGSWFRRSIHMINLLNDERVNGIVGVIRTLEAIAVEETAASMPQAHGDYEQEPIVVAWLDERAVILSVEGSVFELYGRPPDEMVGQPKSQFLAPDAYAAAASTWPHLIANPGSSLVSRQQIIRPDGSVRWLGAFFF